MSVLLDKSWIEENLASLEAWKQDAYKSFAAMLNNKDQLYPCVPAQRGFHSNHLRFGFIGDPRNENTSQELAQLLKEYGQCSRETGKYASLVVFCETSDSLIQTTHVEGYENMFWSLLSNVSELDEKEWPEEIPKEPEHHAWEFCFDGEPYFSFCATPSHQVRKSRHFPYFLLAFQPRWVFEEINDSTSFGRNIKKAIRKRLLRFDEIEPHPDLKWYGQKDNHEWKQYFLRDDDTSAAKCPFTAMRNKLKNLRK
ncbi:YqcI/YcgG family protein [Bacillus timonensis]|nr:YqcI/YcgG family protein [Bacillus timonensis]